MIAIGSIVELRSVRTEKDPTRGLFVIRVWEGTRDAINGIVSTLSSDQTYTIDDSDSPLYRLTVRTPDDDTLTSSSEVVNTWELLGNDIQKDLYEHPKSLAVTESDLRKIRDAIANPGDTPPTLTGDADTLYKLLLKGTNAYVVSQYVLRKTQTVSSRFQTLVAFANIEKIHTTAQVISAEAVPSTLIFSISQIPIPASQTGYQWGWLKKTPTVSQLGTKFQITQEYWLEQWSTYIYDLAT